VKLRGVSLMEAVVAIFILAGGSLACFTLLIQAFRYQFGSESTNSAVLLAERTLGAIRSWATHPDHFDSDWSVYAHQSVQLAEFPGLEARVSVGDLEDTHANVKGTARVVEVVVMRNSRRVVAMTGLMTSPPRRPRATDALQVRPLSPAASLGADQVVEYRAALYDVNDRPIPGVSFEFSQQGLAPTPGAGSLNLQLPDGVKLTHALSPSGHDPGQLQVLARARYRGSYYQGTSDPLELLPP